MAYGVDEEATPAPPPLPCLQLRGRRDAAVADWAVCSRNQPLCRWLAVACCAEGHIHRLHRTRLHCTMKVIGEAICNIVNKMFGGLLEELTPAELHVDALKGKATLENLLVKPEGWEPHPSVCPPVCPSSSLSAWSARQ
eukprot:COSAG01_NODE_1201_length_11274_cov_639.212349_2_plen_139_part_00